MKRITRERIEKHFGEQKGIKRLWWGGWFVDLESGATVTISRMGIDFGKYREIENRKNIEEWLFQGEIKSSILLANDIWGSVGFRGSKAEDRAAILDFSARLGIDTGDQGLVHRHFGPEATIKTSSQGLTVTVPNRGYATCRRGAIEEVSGDLLRPTLMMFHEIAPDKVIVRGKEDLVGMATREGRGMGIKVIPESDMGTFITIASNCSFFGCTIIAFQWLNLLSSILAGFVGGYFLCNLALGIFSKPFEAMARREGLKMVPFETAAPVRKASKDAAKKRGML